MSRALLLCIAALLLAAPAYAQGREAFVRALVEFINATTLPQEDRLAEAAALDRMAAGLAEWDAAISRAEAGLAADVAAAPPPIGARMRTALALLYLERGRADDALAQFDLAIKAGSPPPELHLFRGWALRAAGRQADAADAFRRAFDATAGDPISAYLFLHQSRVARRPADQATSRAAAAILPLEPGLLGIEAGAPPFVVPALIDDAAAGEAILPPARFAEGFALLRQGRYAEAIAALRKGVGAPAAQPDVRGPLARAKDLLARGSEQEALEQLEAAAARNPILGAAALYRLIGQLRENHFDAEGAIDAFVRAIDANPNDAAAHRELAEAFQGVDRLAEARVEFIVSLRIDPRNAVTWTGLGQIHAAEGRLDPAIAAFQRAVALDARSREARYALARALIRVGRTAEGQRELETYERLQAEAMEEERRRYEENLRRIERGADPAGAQR